MLYFDSLSKKSTPSPSQRNTPSASRRSLPRSPCSCRSENRSPFPLSPTEEGWSGNLLDPRTAYSRSNSAERPRDEPDSRSDSHEPDSRIIRHDSEFRNKVYEPEPDECEPEPNECEPERARRPPSPTLKPFRRNTLADMSKEELERYLASFQPAMLGHLDRASLGIRAGDTEEDVSMFYYNTHMLFLYL